MTSRKTLATRQGTEAASLVAYLPWPACSTLNAKRDQALAEYSEALAVRDGQLDTRLAAERGVKAAYVQRRAHEHDWR